MGTIATQLQGRELLKVKKQLNVVAVWRALLGINLLAATISQVSRTNVEIFRGGKSLETPYHSHNLHYFALPIPNYHCNFPRGRVGLQSHITIGLERPIVRSLPRWGSIPHEMVIHLDLWSHSRVTKFWHGRASSSHGIQRFNCNIAKNKFVSRFPNIPSNKDYTNWSRPVHP